MGTEVGCRTDEDFTVFHLRCLRQHFEASWEILADLVLRPLLLPEELEVVRRQMLLGIRQRRDDPDGYLGDLARELVYEGHPYAPHPDGTEASVGALDGTALRAHFQARLLRRRLLLVVVGDVEGETIVARSHAAFAALPPGDGALPAPPALRFARSRLRVQARELPTHYILGQFAAPALEAAEHPAALLTLSVLRDRLFEEVRTKRNLSYAPGAGLGNQAANLGWIYVTAVEPARTLAVMLDEMRRLRDQPLEAKELHDKVQVYVTRYHLQNEDEPGASGLPGPLRAARRRLGKVAAVREPPRGADTGGRAGGGKLDVPEPPVHLPRRSRPGGSLGFRGPLTPFRTGPIRAKFPNNSEALPAGGGAARVISSPPGLQATPPTPIIVRAPSSLAEVRLRAQILLATGLALLAISWPFAAVQAGQVLSLLTQVRHVTASATVTPEPPAQEETVSASQEAPDFESFEASVGANLGAGGPPLGTGTASQSSTIVGEQVHAEGRAAASGGCSTVPAACGIASAVSEFSIRFLVREATMVRLLGRVESEAGAPPLRVAIDGPGVTLVTEGNGGSEDIDLEALLTTGEYVLEARVAAQSGEAGSFRFDATFDDALVGVEGNTWSQVKQLFR